VFNLDNLDFNNYFLLIIKIFFILISILFLVFSLIVVKQVNSMSKNITDKFNQILKIASYVYLIFSIILTFSTFSL
jgi:hypothetical protein